jgi:hypothetical protein
MVRGDNGKSYARTLVFFTDQRGPEHANWCWLFLCWFSVKWKAGGCPLVSILRASAVTRKQRKEAATVATGFNEKSGWLLSSNMLH